MLLRRRLGYVPAKVEVTQVGLGGAHCFEVFKHVTQLFANSLNIVTLFLARKRNHRMTCPQDVKG